MAALTSRMQECLQFIERNVALTGIAPTMQEICSGIGLSPKSKARASTIVRALEERGLIHRVRLRDGKIARRGIVLVKQNCPHCGEALPSSAVDETEKREAA